MTRRAMLRRCFGGSWTARALLVSVSLWSWSGITTAQQPTPGTKWALLIGVDDYIDTQLGKLEYCGADVRALEKVLVEQANFPPDQVITLHDQQQARGKQPLRLSIERNLRALVAQPKRGDIVLIAFSGHGIEHRDGDTKVGYLCPADADLDDPKRTMLAVEEVYGMLEKDCRASQKIVLIDACRNAPKKQRKGPSDEIFLGVRS